ncbi:hypothetical protein GH754_12885 [Salinibacillus xinjiangensis]|uniref:Uncharacterized protein n=1 Tax=Salinibacillus xinjiangensis TaxID=1229268 RepID=A0A6G1X873_9BACI|nr:hypothetical protein [Salinibacillus xinjiangensis]
MNSVNKIGDLRYRVHMETNEDSSTLFLEVPSIQPLKEYKVFSSTD